MSEYRRIRRPGATIFFTLCLEEKGSDLLTARIDDLRAAFRKTHSERPFYVNAIVVLPDHLHAVLTLPPGDSDYANRWRLIKSRFTRAIDLRVPRPSHIRRGESGIWQRRFWEHHIRNGDDLQNHVEFCRSDPVRHGYVTQACQWPYSSLHRDMDRGIRSARHAV